MNSITPDFEPLTLRGSGTFGHVIEAYDRINDLRVAIKRIPKITNKLGREYEIITKLSECPYIVKFYGTFYSVNYKGHLIQNLIFEYINNSLENYINELRKKEQYIPINTIKKIAKQILLALKYCHKKNIVHRDFNQIIY